MGKNARREWFGTACCPANIARLVASVGNYIYATSDKGIWINLFVGNKTSIPVAGRTINLDMKGNYPWDGNISISVDPDKKTKTAITYQDYPDGQGILRYRVELYAFSDSSNSKTKIMVNGKAIDYTVDKGYAVIEREWKKGDKIELQLPLEIRRIKSRPKSVRIMEEWPYKEDRWSIAWKVQIIMAVHGI